MQFVDYVGDVTAEEISSVVELNTEHGMTDRETDWPLGISLCYS
jgi:hypothetical protein